MSDSNPSSSRTYRGNNWGVYSTKPVCQVDFDNLVVAAASEAANVTVQSDVRPRIYDYNSGAWLLLDSGAAISCFPKQPSDTVPDPDRALKAVNGARINTYGTRTIKLNFGGKTYTHDFIIASV